MNMDKTGKRTMEDYLHSLKNCPENRLEVECGIYDNFPILVKEIPDNINSYIADHPKFKFIKIISLTESEERWIFHYRPGTVEIKSSLGIGFYFNGSKEEIDWQKTTL